MPSDDGERLKRRMQRRMKREDGGLPVIAELPNFSEPLWWEKRVERLYRVHILPRLEAKERKESLTEIEKGVRDKARAFLAAYDHARKNGDA